MPHFKPWIGIRNMGRELDSFVYVQTLGQRQIVINDADMAIELLEKRSSNSADRPWANLVVELFGTGQDMNFDLFPYGPRWRQHRRIFWQQYHPGTLSKYHPLLCAETRKFVASFSPASQPSQCTSGKIRLMLCSVLLKLVHDIEVADEHDENIARMNTAFEAMELATPAYFVVESFPFLQYIPSWFPGADFHELFRKSKTAGNHLKHVLFITVKVSSEGRVPTSATTIQAFFVSMAMFPDVQRKAQAELDAFIGTDRLPDFGDSDSLVYVHALVKELLRWHSVIPLGISHRTTGDDEFRGFFIPGGTKIMANIWAMMHDPEVYEDPDEFRPERFIRLAGPNSSGTGPGVHLRIW
ncbi:cytochrome P450 [Trametes meyenii]|nr:cytochrome P450 [Trametes meyenii]